MFRKDHLFDGKNDSQVIAEFTRLLGSQGLLHFWYKYGPTPSDDDVAALPRYVGAGLVTAVAFSMCCCWY